MKRKAITKSYRYEWVRRIHSNISLWIETINEYGSRGYRIMRIMDNDGDGYHAAIMELEEEEEG